MTTYQLCKKMIKAKVYAQVDIQKRVDTFYAFGRLSDEEYAELMQLIETVYA